MQFINVSMIYASLVAGECEKLFKFEVYFYLVPNSFFDKINIKFLCKKLFKNEVLHFKQFLNAMHFICYTFSVCRSGPIESQFFRLEKVLI